MEALSFESVSVGLNNAACCDYQFSSIAAQSQFCPEQLIVRSFACWAPRLKSEWWVPSSDQAATATTKGERGFGQSSSSYEKKIHPSSPGKILINQTFL